MSSGLKITSQLYNAEALLLATAGADGAAGVQGPVGLQGIAGGGGDLNVNPVKIGEGSGATNQSVDAVAVGISAGGVNQSQYGVAIGYDAGQEDQGRNTVAIGFQAGMTRQGENTIAIGALAGSTDQPSNSIVLNATGNPVEALNNGLFIQPIRPPSNVQNSSVTGVVLGYDNDSGEVRRTFIDLYMFSDTLLSKLNFPPRGPTGAIQTPGQLPFNVNGLLYSYPFQKWNVVYNPTELAGTAGQFTFTENISSQMTLDVLSNMTLGLCDVGNVWNAVSTLPNASLRQWQAVAISTSGQYVTIISQPQGGFEGAVYVSDDRGATWQDAGFNDANFVDVAMSGAGDLQCVVSSNGQSLISNDFGATWTASSMGINVGETITSVAIYPIGGDQFIYATSTSQIYVRRPGLDWLPLFILTFDAQGQPIALNVSGSGSKVALAAGGYIGYVSVNANTPVVNQASLATKGIYKSFNGFTDFLQKTSAPELAWRTLSCSANGKFLLASATDDANLWRSSDYGATWTSYPIVNVISCALSFTGQYQVAVQADGVMFISEDYGGTWIPRLNVPPTNRLYRDVAITSSGQELYAIGNNMGVLYSISTVCGSVGEKGAQGVQGVTGPSGGPTGPIGSQGFQGFDGFQGFQGFTGPDGFGLQGLQGWQGETGSLGPQGPTGLGFQGLAGRQGSQGRQGPQGRQGATGLGFQGRQGVQGVTGTQGFQGRQGATGLGFQGRQGVTGLQGRQGRQGATGLGFQGVQGMMGLPGGAVINSNPVKIGFESGLTGQATDSTAVGIFAAMQNQGPRSVAIGWQAGMSSQGGNAIAIGPQAGLSNQANHSIILNASSEPLNAGTTGFFVHPIRYSAGFGAQGVAGLQGPVGPTGLLGPQSGIGGANTQIQFNNNGLFTGSANLVYNPTTNVLTVGQQNATGFQVFGSFTQGATGVVPSSTGGAKLAVSSSGRFIGMDTSTANTSSIQFKSFDGSSSAFDGQLTCSGGRLGQQGYGDITLTGRNFALNTTNTNDQTFVSIQPNVRYPVASLYPANAVPRNLAVDHIISSGQATSINAGGLPVDVLLPTALVGYRLEVLCANGQGSSATYNGFFIVNTTGSTGTYSPSTITTTGSAVSLALGNTGVQPKLTVTNSAPALGPPVVNFMILAWAI